MKHSGIVILLFCCWLLSACGQKQAKNNIVTVTIEPQRFFAEKIAGEQFEIHCVVPSGQSPETYDPTPKQMVQIGQSTAYLRIGAIGFEQTWMNKIKENTPGLKIYDLSENMPFIRESTDEAHDLRTSRHHTGGIDPHIWSSIGGARVIAWNTLQAFIGLDKAHSSYYWDNYNKLSATIDSTEAELKRLLSPLRGHAFIIYHPALTYLAEEFGLIQLCIETEGKEPSPVQLEQLVAEAKRQQAHVVLIQQEFDRKNAELIAKETGCRLITVNPLDFHWDKELIHIATALNNGETD